MRPRFGSINRWNLRPAAEAPLTPAALVGWVAGLRWRLAALEPVARATAAFRVAERVVEELAAGRVDAGLARELTRRERIGKPYTFAERERMITWSAGHDALFARGLVEQAEGVAARSGGQEARAS